MAKVKRSEPLEGETWDLSLGAVQHTSRWGTIARAKGSTLRYYPGCPWEKRPKQPPPPLECEPGCLPPSGPHQVILHMGYSGPLWGEPFGGALYVGFTPSAGGPIRWTILGQSSSFCPLSIEWEFLGVSSGWLLVYWKASGECGEYWAYNALAIPGCSPGPVPSGFFSYPVPFTDPPQEWPGPTAGCLFATCTEWVACGPVSGIVLPE
jgi:hypothetical protein